jgi:type I restriction enzyme S subunit
MSEINYPADWKSSKVEEITQFLGRGVGPNYSEYESNTVAINQKCVRNGAVNTVFGRYHLEQVAVRTSAILKNGDVCINSTGDGTIGRVGLWKNDDDKKTFFVDSHVTIARPIEGVINSKYLNELLSSDWIQTDLERFCFTGSTNQIELSRSSLLLLKLFYPDISKQQKIAKILSTVDNLIEKTQTLIDKYTAIKQGMMADLFTRGIDMTTGDTPNSKGGKLRPSVEDAPELYKQTELGWVPKEWEARSIDDISIKVTDGDHHTPIREEQGVLLLSARNVLDGRLRFDSVDYVPEFEYKRMIKRCFPEAGDILVSCSGTIGRVCEVPKDIRFSLVRSVALIKLNKEQVNSKFVQWHLRTARLKKIMIDSALQAAQPNLFQAAIKKLPTNLCSADEQQEIANRLDAIENMIACYEKEAEQYKNTKKGLMKDLLTGKVRVN